MDLILGQQPAEARDRAGGQQELQGELGNGGDASADGLDHKGSPVPTVPSMARGVPDRQNRRKPLERRDLSAKTAVARNLAASRQDVASRRGQRSRIGRNCQKTGTMS